MTHECPHREVLRRLETKIAELLYVDDSGCGMPVEPYEVGQLMAVQPQLENALAVDVKGPGGDEQFDFARLTPIERRGLHALLPTARTDFHERCACEAVGSNEYHARLTLACALDQEMPGHALNRVAVAALKLHAVCHAASSGDATDGIEEEAYARLSLTDLRWLNATMLKALGTPMTPPRGHSTCEICGRRETPPVRSRLIECPVCGLP